MPLSIDAPIIVPFDFSEHALEAIEYAVRVKGEGTEIHVLHVLPFIIPTEPGVVWGTVDDASRIEHAIKAMREELPIEKYGELKLDVRLGDPGTIATELAQSLNAGLMVVGSHGRTGVSRMILGSVAERVARLAPCPVLLVKKQKEA